MGGTCWSPVPVTRASVTWSGTPLTAVWSSVSPTRSRRRGPDVQDQHARRAGAEAGRGVQGRVHGPRAAQGSAVHLGHARAVPRHDPVRTARAVRADRKSTRLNSSHVRISYAVFCLKKKTSTPTTLLHLSLRVPPESTLFPYTTLFRS